MLYGFLVTLYVFLCILLVLLVMVQKGKGSMGLGGIGAGSQMLFGGSGGQDIFQKTTWVLGACFMLGSLGIALMATRQSKQFNYLKQQTAPANVPTQKAPAPDATKAQ